MKVAILEHFRLGNTEQRAWLAAEALELTKILAKAFRTMGDAGKGDST